MPVAARLAVLMTCDQFPTASIGCYGNDWVDTTALDSLAAEGFVFDRCLTNRVDEAPDSTAMRLVVELRPLLQQGVRLVVVEEAELPSLEHFLPDAEFRRCFPGRTPPESAADLPGISLLNIGRELISEFSVAPLPTLIWLRSAGVSPDAIPPVEAFELYADELEELATHDPESADETLVEHPALRAAYISLLDYQLGEFCRELRQLAQPVLLQWTAFRSWPWVSISRQTPVWGELDAARIHVPWIVWEHRTGDLPVSWEPGRSTELVQTSDLPPSVREWFTCPEHRTDATGLWSLITTGGPPLRDLATTYGQEGAVSFWTSREQIILAPRPSSESPGTPTAQRYWQPEDPWNVFDASGVSEERIAELAPALHSAATRQGSAPLSGRG